MNYVPCKGKIKIGFLRIFDDSNRFFKAIWQFLQRQNQNYILKHIINWKKQIFCNTFSSYTGLRKLELERAYRSWGRWSVAQGRRSCEREREWGEECLVWIWGKRMGGFRKSFSFQYFIFIKKKKKKKADVNGCNCSGSLMGTQAFL